jgi:hypothetical protein
MKLPSNGLDHISSLAGNWADDLRWLPSSAVFHRDCHSPFEFFVSHISRPDVSYAPYYPVTAEGSRLLVRLFTKCKPRWDNGKQGTLQPRLAGARQQFAGAATLRPRQGPSILRCLLRWTARCPYDCIPESNEGVPSRTMTGRGASTGSTSLYRCRTSGCLRRDCALSMSATRKSFSLQTRAGTRIV